MNYSCAQIKLWDPKGTARATLALIALCTILSFLGKHYWFFDLFCHWHSQYAIASLLTAVYYSSKKEKLAAGVAVALFLLHLFYILPFYFAPSVDLKNNNSYEQVTITQINLCAQNLKTQATVDYLRTRSFQILSLVELTPLWQEALRQLESKYPYRIVKPQDDCFGVALWSKLPIRDHRIVAYVSASAPSIEATIVINERPITFLVTHTLPPKSGLLSRCRDEQLLRIGKRKNTFHEDIVLLGDLNNTPWSHSYVKLANSLNLYNSRQGFGICASWPTVAPPLLIPIDHCLLSRTLKTNNFRIGQPIGSDHYPLEITIGVPSKL